MRVVEPHQFYTLRKKKNRKFPYKVVILVALISCLATMGYLTDKQYFNPRTFRFTSTRPNHKDPTLAVAPLRPLEERPLKTFTGDQFKELYRSIRYPNTQAIINPPAITDNLAADSRIRKLAESHGYRLTSTPVNSIVKIHEPGLIGDDDLLQPLAAKAWKQLKDLGAKDGIKLSLISAYRSIDWQRDLFLSRLVNNGANSESVAAGKEDAAIEATLHMAAIPGYSRHHTGYTVDLLCLDGSGSFSASSCYRWISANNYAKAKQVGWIPSYPEGADEQGPEPEAWEYVWVGQDILRGQ